jgi:hypothetical protein
MRISPIAALPERRRAFRIRILVEAECHLPALDQNRPPYQVWLLHHQINRFLLRLRQWPLLEDWAPGADEIQKPRRVDVFLEKSARRRIPVDVVFFDVDVVLLQKTSGVAARGSGWFPVEEWPGHPRILPASAPASGLQLQWKQC